MPTVQQDVAAIRTAVYGRDVREAIADGIENCYSDVSRAKTLADDATAAAATAVANAGTAVTNAQGQITTVNQVIQQASEVINTAEGAATDAADAAEAATDAKNAANTATAAANAAASSANTAAETANAAAEDAADAATIATAAANTAATAAGSANTAATAASNATTAANNAATAANTAATAATTAKDNINDELARKANIDGYYTDMTVGDAEQLVSTQAIEDTAIYSMRKAGGPNDVQDREYLDKIIGGTVAWNQVSPNSDATGSPYPNNATTSYSSATDTTTYSATLGSEGWGYASKYISEDWRTIGHVYLLSFNVTATNVTVVWGKPDPGEATPVAKSYGSGGMFNFIQKASTIVSNSFLIGLSAPSGTAVTAEISKINLFDLTQMFGSAIADYIYGLEQANTGDGVSFFRKLFPASYYPYNAGELVSVNALSHDTVGFNQWDEEWEVGDISSQTGENVTESNMIRSKNYIHVFPGTNYYIESEPSMRLRYYDANKQYIGAVPSWNTAKTITTPSNCHYIRFATHYGYGNVYKNNICINLSDPARNGEYEPYEKHTHPMADIDLRGMVKLDEEGNLYYDGDEYTPDGTVTRKYGIVDLGTLDWHVNSQEASIFQCLPPNMAQIIEIPYENRQNGAVCSKYLTSSRFSISDAMDDKSWLRSTNRFFIRDTAYTTADALKAAMSGVYLVYELATPTTEEADPFTNVQVIDNSGTEAFATGTVMPVQAEARFPANLRDKLQHLPGLADADGNYLIHQTGTNMKLVPYNVPDTVENAKQLIATVGMEDQVPYTFRTAGGSADIGDRENDKIVGGTVAWNQKVDPPLAGTTTSAGVTFTYDGNGQITCSGTPNDWSFGPISKTSFSFIKSHKYFLCGCPAGGSEAFLRIWVGSVSAFPPGHRLFDDGRGKILDALTDETGVAAHVMIGTAYTGDISKLVFIPQLFDLTQMFGSAIANYIYSLEQSHAGDGVAWFRKLFPKSYYAYNSGELLSVDGLQSHDMTGFNQWDEEWELGTIQDPNVKTQIRTKNYIKIFPNTWYYWRSDSNNGVVYYDKSKHVIGNYQFFTPNTSFKTPENAYYMKFWMPSTYGATYKNDICINLYWDGERNGEYEPYTLYSYPLDSDLVLRGIPKLDSNNKLYYDGDTYEPDGTVTRRYGIVDLGACNWFAQDDCYYSVLSEEQKGVNNSNLVCTKYTYSDYAKGSYRPDKTINLANSYYGGRSVSIKDTAYSTAADLKAALSGVYLVYELYTPTTETSESFSDPQIVDDWGTEEYVTDSIVPVGHDTRYQPNLRAKLETSPDSPDSNGDYVVRHVNGENTYVPLVIPNELPATPTSNGTYVLKVTVSNGTPTLSWVAG